MYDGATLLTRMPRGPSSVASDEARCSSAPFDSLYPAYSGCEEKETQELSMMIEPFDSDRESAKRADSRSGAKTLVSLTFASLRGSIWVIGSIGGIVNALLMTQSTRPNASRVLSRRLTRDSSSVTSVTTLTTLTP